MVKEEKKTSLHIDADLWDRAEKLSADHRFAGLDGP